MSKKKKLIYLYLMGFNVTFIVWSSTDRKTVKEGWKEINKKITPIPPLQYLA